MKFNTAIFYDIENLIGGYKKENLLPFVSLKTVHQSITEKLTGKVAVQRAYANWNTPRLSVLCEDIVHLGIDPIQMFGFGRGPDQNASDIQLAIDVVELVFQHEMIDTFVIVSGDGGFSALAKKLHKYGKTVIGCSYPRTTSQVLEGVCDSYIWLDDPLEEAEKMAAAQIERVVVNPVSPIVSKFKQAFSPLTAPDRDKILYEARCILEFFVQDESQAACLQGKNGGIKTATYNEILKYRLGGLSYPFLGFSNSVEFLRYITQDSPCKLVQDKSQACKLLLKSADCPEGYTDVKLYGGSDDVHTAEHYRSLWKKADLQLFTFPSPRVLYEVLNYIIDNLPRFRNSHINSMLSLLEDAFDHDSVQLRAILMFLRGVNCFEEQDGKVLHIPLMSFMPENEAAAVQQICGTVYPGLLKTLGHVDMDAFNAMFPAQWCIHHTL